MQSHCIYAEAFAGPFQPLRAPEPPFTHKTPPFTQVLFLFDAFYGTISLRKPSSLCSYKTESEAPMKKRILALLLAFSMMLSLLPVSALADTGGGIDFAAYASNGSLPDLVMTTDGIPDTSNAASRTEDNKTIWYGTDWTYEIIDKSHSTLTLKSGSYNFNNTKPTTEDGETLKLVKCKVVVESGATITGGWFRQMLNYGTVENSLLSNNDIENCGGTMTNCLFKCSKPPVGVANYHKLTEVNNNVFDATLLNAPSGFMGWETYYFTGTPKLVVKLAKPGGFNELQCINGRTDYGGLRPSDVSGYYTFTPNAGEDVVLNLNYYITDLVITKDGFPDTTGREPIYQDNDIIGYKGDGWTYMLNSATNEKGILTLTERSDGYSEYIFSDSSWNHSTAIECDVIVDATHTYQVQLTHGTFNGAVTFNGSGTGNAPAVKCIFNGTVKLEGSKAHLIWSYFGKDAHLVCSGNGLIRHCVFAGDTSGSTFSTDPEYCLFASKPAGLTTYELRTEDNKEFSATLYSNLSSHQDKCPEKLTGQMMYVQKDANLVVRRTDGLKIMNGTALTETDWSGWYYPSDTILKRNYHLTVENGTLNDTTHAQGYFGSGASITVQANAPTDTNTFFAGWAVTPADTKLMNGTADVDLTQSTITFDMPIVIAPDGLTLTATYAPYVTDLVMTPDGIPVTTGREPIYDTDGKTIIGCKGNGWKYENDTLTLESGSYDFSQNGLGQLAPDVKLVVGPNATLTGGVFNEKPEGLTTDNVQTIILNGSGSIEAVNGLSSPKWNTTLYAIKDSQVEIKADTDITNINGWDIGKFPGSYYPNGEDDKKTVSFRMPDGPVVLNDTLYTLDIIRGTMWGNTSVAVPAGTELPLEADEPAKNETFLGWTLSDESLLTEGTLNDPECKTITIKMKNAGATAEAKFQKDTPAYTLTVTGGGLVNDKTSAVVEAGDEVRLTTGEMQEGMSFNYWDLPTALIKALTAEDSNFSNKVENLTFTIPDLSEYTEDTRFTIRLDIRPAELPDDDDGPSVLGTMATVAVGGAAAGILVWQGVSLGVDSYLQLSLPGGVPVPANRIELVKLLWETAGKPDVVLPALYGDVSTEDAELQKATRWAIDNGLVKSADEGDASRFDPDRSVSKYEVARAWFKVQQMLK